MERTSSFVGEIRMSAGLTAPFGWLTCDGSAVSRTEYAALFAEIQDAYGPGNGTTTFNLPDMRGTVPMGAGAGAGRTARVRGVRVGAETHLLTAAESGEPGHNHAQAAHSHTNILGAGAGAVTTAQIVAGLATYGTTQQSAGTTAVNTAAPAAAAAQAHNNMQPSLAVTFLICWNAA